MAAAGKKSKKHKGKTIPLTDFLADGTPDPGPGKVIRSTAWADEVENEEAGNLTSGPNVQTVVLPTAPREVQSSCTEDTDKTVPWKPPFKAYIANLHYDTNEKDIIELFANIKIVDLQLAREGNGRLKGYGHVEFETRDNLLAAIAMTELQVRGRWMKISIPLHADAEGFCNSERRHYGRTDRRYETRVHDPDRTQGDWRSGPRQEIPPPSNSVSYGRSGVGVKDRGTFTRHNMETTPYRDNFSRSYMNVPQEQGAYRRYTNRDRNLCDDRSENTRGYLDRETSYENRYRNQSRNYEGNNRSGNYGNAYQQRNRYGGYGGNRERQTEHEVGREPRWNYGDQRRPPEVDKPRPRLCLTQRSALNSEVVGASERVEAETSKVTDSEVANSEWSVSTTASSLGDDRCTSSSSSDNVTQDDEDIMSGGAIKGEESLFMSEGDEVLSKTFVDPVRRDLDEAVQEDISDKLQGKKSDLVQEMNNVSVQDTGTEIFGTSDVSSKDLGVPVPERNESQGADEGNPECEVALGDAKGSGGDRCCPVKVEELVMQHLRQEPEQRSSIFGGAKPVDTSAREMEVEERLAREREEARWEVERRLPKERRDAEGSRQRMRQHRPTPAIPSLCGGVGVVADIPPVERVIEQPVKPLEVPLPPKENVWLRRAAQMAAKKEREQFLGVITEQLERP